MPTHRAATLAFAAVAGWFAAIATPPLAAQQPVEMPRLLDPSRGGGPVQFRIVSGRVTMSVARLGGYSTSTTSGGRTERLTVGTNGAEPVLSYKSLSPSERLTIEATGSHRLVIQRSPEGTSAIVPIEYAQTANEPVTLAVGPAEQQQTYRAASLWHLLLAEPDVCRQHLAPLLKVLHKDWDLLKAVEEMEAALLAPASAQELPDRRRWAALVEQLGDSRFSQREAADRQLREAGRAVVTFLRQLDAERLDAEQQYRIRRILAALSATEDLQSPQQVVAWLCADPAVWLIFLARQDEPTRRLAASRLETLLGRPLGFDPGADAATRQRQIERLRKELAGG